MDKLMARDSIESLGVKITSKTPAGTAVDPTGNTVAIAVLPVANTDPVDGDYVAATWETGPDGTFAKRLVGPLAIGTYKVWVKITATPEIPVIRSPDRLIVY